MPFDWRHWELVLLLKEESERLFGIPVAGLLQVDGASAPPERVYRAIARPRATRALQPEEAWVRHQ